MSPKFKRLWRPSLFKLMLMVSPMQLLQLLLLLVLLAASSAPAGARRAPNAARAFKLPPDQLSDPMEPCYLANNRASESLTISESTPVGTVVGEILVSDSLSLSLS